ncbi:DUF6262 family protein [Nonomuraea sp. NPDC049504]|uniref:DUF6262 family protein n=1 Tax=Nonomuraea sp. NPDC049504 TaxID=3154729 RepID=UPI00341C2E19
MPSDNSHHLAAAARRRAELTRAKAVQALRELVRTGEVISFDRVARAAGVSRSWLYAQPDLRAEIERLRQATRPAPEQRVPAIQRTSEASLLARLQSALDRNRELAKENQRLRRQLAQALGERRAPQLAEDQPAEPAGQRRSSITIGPC